MLSQSPEHQRSRAEALRALHHGPLPLVLANAWDVASAKIFANAGASAIATTSAGIAASLGYPDGQLVDPALMIESIARIAAAVDLPLSADLEAGYGETAPAVRSSAEAALRAGAVGINLEDTTGSSDGPLLNIEQQVQKILSIREMSEEFGVPLVINARTDVFLAAVGEPRDRLEEAVRRANSYRAAGADCLFVPGVKDAETIGLLVREIDGPLNVLAVPGTPSIPELAALGVARVSLGSAPMRATLALAERIARELQGEGTYSELSAAVPYRDLLKLFS